MSLRASASGLRRRWRSERGSELIEFALVSILLFMLVFGIMEFGRAIWVYNTVAHLAREGARYAMVRGSESGTGTLAADVTAYVNSRAAGMTNLTVTTTWLDASHDPGTAVEVRVARPFDAALPLVGMDDLILHSTSRVVISY